jgi:hypothetical protein
MIELPDKPTFTREEVLELLKNARKRTPKDPNAIVTPKPKKEKELWQTPRYLLNIPEEDILGFAKEYPLTREQIIKAGSTCHKWMQMKGTLYFAKDYRARLDLWLDKDSEHKKEKIKEASPLAPKFDNTDFP